MKKLRKSKNHLSITPLLSFACNNTKYNMHHSIFQPPDKRDILTWQTSLEETEVDGADVQLLGRLALMLLAVDFAFTNIRIYSREKHFAISFPVSRCFRLFCLSNYIKMKLRKNNNYLQMPYTLIQVYLTGT